MRADPLPVASADADAVTTARDELDRARSAGNKLPPAVVAALHDAYAAACRSAGVLTPPPLADWPEAPQTSGRNGRNHPQDPERKCPMNESEIDAVAAAVAARLERPLTVSEKIAAETRKLPAVDANGRPVTEGTAR